MTCLCLPFSVQIDYIHNTPDQTGLNLSVDFARDPSSIVIVLYRYKGLQRAKRVQNKSALTACQDWHRIVEVEASSNNDMLQEMKEQGDSLDRSDLAISLSVLNR